MRLEQMNHIIEIERCKSISKAAKELFISQPSLSTSLSNLEEEIGVKIFERTSMGVVPTKEGEEILSQAKQMLSCAYNITNYKNVQDDLVGDVFIEIAPGYTFLTNRIIKEFKSLYPNANLIIDDQNSGQVIDDIHKGLINIGLISWELFPYQVPEVLYEKHIMVEKFSTHEVCLYVGNESGLAKKKKISFDQIKDEQFVSYSPGFWASVNTYLKADKEPIILKERENIQKMVHEGYAIALLPDTFSKEDMYFEQGLIKMLPIDDMPIKGVDYLIYPKRKALSILEKGVLDILRSILGELKENKGQVDKDTL